MLKNRSITGRHIGLFFFGWFVLSHPILTIFNLPIYVFGIPLHFFYLFTAWAGLIILTAFCGKAPEPFHLPGPEDTGKNITPSG